MWILGISEIDNDAGAALFHDGRLVGAVNEERFSRLKRHRGVPALAVRWLLAHAGIDFPDLDRVIIAKPRWPAEFRYNNRDLVRHPWLEDDGLPLAIRALTPLVVFGWRIPRNTADIIALDGQMQRWLEANGVPPHRVFRCDHHRAHAACAYYASGWPEALLLTTDGQGGGVTASVHLGRNGALRCLARVRVPHSLGLFYGAATKALGFRPGRHEGKVTGLAAYRPPDPECLAFCRRLARHEDGRFVAPHVYGAYPEMKRLLARVGPEAFAAAFQVVLEEVVTAFARNWVRRTGIGRVGLAGGVFGNVKLNQRIHEIPEVTEIFVFPHMADGGLGYGAALEHWHRGRPYRPEPLEHVYWGPEYSEREIEAALVRSGEPYDRPADGPGAVARLLVEGRVVGRFDGRMEFGPRALGHRSILYRPDDPSVNDWLNRALRRTEFMPFAPVTLAEYARSCYEGMEGAERTAEFMTITFACTEEMRSRQPAVVHVDGTARPQILHRERSPFYYDIVEAFRRETGIPSVINTSFNMHEEPIVCTPEDAIRAYRLGHLDALSIGPFLCQRPGGREGTAR